MSSTASGPSEPEFLGDGPAGPAGPAPEGADGTDGADGGRGGRGRRTGIIAAVAVAAVAVIGGASYGVVQLMSGGGDAAASAVPADALGYVSLDLDPSAAQKIEAIRILRKFPALKEQLDIDSRDDIRRAVFDKIVESGDCPGLDYDTDVKPWLGERVAVAALPDAEDGAAPLGVIQVSDEDAAKKGWATLQKCDSSDTKAAGIAFSGDYMLVAETQKEAAAAAEDAGSASLADDEDFQSWTDQAGDPGIVTMYAAPGAAKAILDAQQKRSPGSADDAQVAKLVKNFQGAAGVVRFADGAVEVEYAAKGLGDDAMTGSEGTAAGRLPATTAAALSIALPDGWFDTTMARLRSSVGADQVDQAFRQLETQTGLDLPEDIETLLGDGVTVSVDAKADVDALTSSPDPSQIPVALRLQGDPSKIEAVVRKIQSAAGPQGAELLKVASGDGVVAVGPDRAYLDRLLEDGGLGSASAFEKAVPDADQAGVVLFVNFDAGGGWAERLADAVAKDDPSVRQNVAPLDALGVSGWVDEDKVSHGLVRLSTD